MEFAGTDVGSRWLGARGVSGLAAGTSSAYRLGNSSARKQKMNCKHSVVRVSWIDADNGFLALASGNDGVLVYQWNGSLDVDLLTRIDSGDDNYIYDVKVDGNHVYTASENGISIYKIEGN